MPQRKRTSRPTRPGKHWALILIDGRPVREKARRQYEKIKRELEQARCELERFEKHDQPGFSRWLSAHFGALLTEMRETSAKLEAQRLLLFQIETEAFLSNSSYVRAYERIKAQQEAAAQGDPFQSESARGSQKDEDFGPDPFEDGSFGYGEAHEPFGFETDPRGEAAPDHRPARLKEIYRALVRRLHPDRNGQPTPQQAEWWHQAQAAYQANDLEQLQVILTLCEIEEDGTTVHTSVSLLLRIITEFKRSLRALKAQLTQRRRDPAWNFAQTSDHQPLARRMERVLRDELFEMQQALGAINAQLEAWAKQAEMARRRGRRRRQPVDEFEIRF